MKHLKKTFSRTVAFICVLTTLLPYAGTFANQADIDTDFNEGVPASFNAQPYAMDIQDDNKILVGGNFTTYQGSGANRIIRLNSDGSRDTSFNIGEGFNGSVYVIVIQDDNKILVGGNFTTYQGSGANRIIRLNSDGSRDTSFDIGSGFDSRISSIGIQSDGLIILGGNFTTYQGSGANRIIRLNDDGSRDTSFDIGSGFNGKVKTINIQDDDKILVGGEFTTYQGVDAQYIVRLNSDGSRDTSFDIGSGFDSSVNTIAIQGTGKILVGGDFSSYQSSGAQYIVRLNSDGSRDTSFDIGSGFDSSVNTIAIQGTGKILVGGDFTMYNDYELNHIIRLDDEGSFDNSFFIGDGFDNAITNFALGNDGKIFVAGLFTQYQGYTAIYITMINNDGSKNSYFFSGDWFDSSIETVALQNDGKILVGGDIRNFEGYRVGRFTRLNSDGSRDFDFESFDGFNGTVRSIVVQEDDKILVGGDFTTYQGIDAQYITRFNIDGSFDEDFNIDYAHSPHINYVYNIALQNDGKILVAGEGIDLLCRLNSDGSKDTSFVTSGGFDDVVNSIVIQDDDKILVGGKFTTYQGVDAQYIVRLNSDGSRDTSFDIGSGFNGKVETINIQDDDKILVGGEFTTYQGVDAQYIVRLNSDGSRDTSFDAGNEFGNGILNMTIQDNGKILVSDSDEGSNTNYLIRLNSDGSRDTTFNVGEGFNNKILSLQIQEDGKILVGGEFTTYKSIPNAYLVALYGDSEFVVIPDSTNTTTVEQEFTDKGYVKSDDMLVGNTPISLEITDGLIPIDLHLQNSDITLSVPENSQFVNADDQSNFDGIISVPIEKTINSLYDEEVLSAFKVGSTITSLELTGAVATLSVPIEGANVGDMVNVYYSEDNGASWYPHGSFMAINNSSDTYASFTTNHFTDFAITLPDTTSFTGSFVINNDAASTTGQEVVLTLATTPAASNMRFSNNGIDRSVWEAYSTSKTRTLSSGYATKTVYAQFDRDGDTTSDVQTSDTILYIEETEEDDDTPPPSSNGGSTILQKDSCKEDRDCSSSYYDKLCGPCEETPKFLIQDATGFAQEVAKVKLTTKGNYSDELIQAYVFAKDLGITSMDTIDQANMTGSLMRSHMAKMIANFSLKILHTSLNTGVVCNFKDIAQESQELQYYMQAACQLGLMGYENNGVRVKSQFDTVNMVDRAQFGTVLSRMLRGTQYAGGTPYYYTDHLNALKNAGIMTKINTPLQEETRGRVMLMLMRVFQNTL